MKMPFTTEQFFGIFEKYNSTFFPAQWIILLIGVLALFLLHSKNSRKNKWIGSFLGTLWIWAGLLYHIALFSEINKAANIFGSLFILQGLLILYFTLFKDRLSFEFKTTAKDYIGYFFIIFGLLIYPLISFAAEGSINRVISLGLPCPSVIMTFGFFMLTSDKFPRVLIIIPSLWAILGLSAAINFGVIQDFMLLISAITADIILISRKK